MNKTINIGSDTLGSLGFSITDRLVLNTFKNIDITHSTDIDYDLVVMSHFYRKEKTEFSCPYICWSGESFSLKNIKSDYAPLFSLETHYSDKPTSIYYPGIFYEVPEIKRPELNDKNYCLTYAYTNRVPIREVFFNYMREHELLCHSFGKSCYTNNNPFAIGREERDMNSLLFNNYAFYAAMENKIIPGYITEKIGFAYNSGAIPIYWGHRSTVENFFNPASFINIDDFSSVEKAANHCLNIWQDKQKLLPLLEKPIFINDNLAKYKLESYQLWQKPAIELLWSEFPDLSKNDFH